MYQVFSQRIWRVKIKKRKKANIIKEIRSQSQKTWKPRHKQKQSQIPQSQKESKQHPSKRLSVYEFKRCEIAEKET